MEEEYPGASIEKIFDDSYLQTCKNVNILYAPLISVNSSKLFDEFRARIHNIILQNINTYISEINSILKETNSNGFMDETKLSILNDTSIDNTTAMTNLSGDKITYRGGINNMLSVINNYNVRLKSAKQKVRKKLLIDAAQSINDRNIETGYNYYISKVLPTSSDYEDRFYDNYMVDRYHHKKEKDGAGIGGYATLLYFYRYYYIRYDQLSISELENIIMKIDGKLPYDKSKLRNCGG